LHCYRCGPHTAVFLNGGGVRKDPDAAYINGGVQLTERTNRKLKITTRSWNLTLETLEQKVEKQSGPGHLLAPSSPQIHRHRAQSTAPLPGTWPLGVEQREQTASEAEILQIGTKARRKNALHR
jgi:hypothetical protein